MQKDAYPFMEFVREVFPLGRSKAYEEIKAGRLTVRKIGRSSVVLRDDWLAYLASLPKSDLSDEDPAHAE